MPTIENATQLLAKGFWDFAESLVTACSGRDTSLTEVGLAPPFTNMSRENWLRALALWQKMGKESLANQQARSCPACGHCEARFIFTSYDGYPFVDCLQCGCWYVPKVVDGNLFDQFFKRCPEAKALAYLMTKDRLEASRTEYDQGHFGALIDELLPILNQVDNPRRKLLDVGCGVGHGLRAGMARGFISVGVEADPDCIALGQEQGLDIRRASDGIPNGSFDLIAMWETLEHVTAPAELLQGLGTSLAVGGLLTVLVPNLNSPSVRVLREDCSVVHGGMNGPGHINLFHAEGLKDLLSRAGFAVLDIDGHFSDNPFELASHVLGSGRGAYDMVFRGRETLALPSAVVTLLNGIWPAISEIERLSLTSPLLRVIACHPEDESRFSEAISKLQERRKAEIESRLARLQMSQDIVSAASALPLNTLQVQNPDWRALPPPERWELSADVRVVKADDSGTYIDGNDSPFGYQLVSPVIPVEPSKALALFMPMFILEGQIAVGVLDQEGAWLLPATTHETTLRVATKDNRFIQVVIANVQHDSVERVRTRFRLQRGYIAFDGDYLSEMSSFENTAKLQVLRTFGEPYQSQCFALLPGLTNVDVSKLRALEPLEDPYRTQCLSMLTKDSSLNISVLIELGALGEPYRSQCFALLTGLPDVDVSKLRALEPLDEPYRTQCLSMLARDPTLNMDFLSALRTYEDPVRTAALAIAEAYPELVVEHHRLSAFAQQHPETAGHADIFFRDILDVAEPIEDDDVHLRAALDWLLLSQEVTGTPGFSAAYSFSHGWLPPYPETTGYIITTLWQASKELGEERFAQCAIAGADWEIEIQMESGAIQAGYWGVDPQGFWKASQVPAAFNTGQVILGWNRTFEETGNAVYLEASVKACRYLMDCLNDQGVFVGGLSPGPTNPQRTYYTRVAYAMAWTGRLSGDPSFESAARSHLDWVVSRQQQSGWFCGASFLEDEMPLTHTMAYTAEGLLLAGQLFEDDRYLDSSERHVTGTMHACERRGFFLPARFLEGWKSTDTFSCLPGNAQFATLWLQHGGRRKDLTLVNSGLKMIDWLKGRQSLRNPAPAIRGGMPASWPIDGGYSTYSYVNWAAKYFIDALLEARHVCRNLRDGE